MNPKPTHEQINALLHGIGEEEYGNEFNLTQPFDPIFLEFQRLVKARMAERHVGIPGSWTHHDVIQRAFELGILEDYEAADGSGGWKLHTTDPDKVHPDQLNLF